MKDVISRLKSPVVLIQLITLLSGSFVLLLPQFDSAVKIVVGAVVGVIQILSGLNNPTDSTKF